MPAQLHIRTVDLGRRIHVRRDAAVPDDFWLTLRAEWGSMGDAPNTAIYLPVETFASRLGWLSPACKRYEVGISWDEATIEIVRRRGIEEQRLQAIRAGAPALSSEATLERLAVGEPPRFTRELRDFQLRDLGRLLALDHGANFSVPGAGKTTVELAVYEAERSAGRVERLLVVAPLSAFDAWMVDSAECLQPAPVVHRFGGGPIPAGTELLLVNYNRLASNYADIADWAAAAPTLVVLDEAHRMKRGRDGEWGTACLDLAHVAVRRDVLSGTPAPQAPSDLVAILDYLWPGQALRVLPDQALRLHPTRAAVAAVTPAIAPLFVRTTKTELELADPNMRIVPVPLVGLQREIYNTLKRDYSAKFAITQRDRLDLSAMGDVVMYLLEAATNPALLAAGSTNDDPIEFRHPPLPVPADSRLAALINSYAQHETPAKFVELAAQLHALEVAAAASDPPRPMKALVWTNFVRNLSTLERMLAVYEPAVVHGGVPSEVSQPDAERTREAEIHRFRTDPSCTVLIANPAAMSEGISLHHECHDAFYLDRTFNAGQYLQSVDRIHRLGLAPGTETNVTFLVTEETIDLTVNRRIAIKAENLGTMLDDPGIGTMSLPDDEDYGSPLDVGDDDDIAALFAHLRGTEDAD